MRLFNYFLILLITVTFSSCKKKNLGDCFKSTGEITEDIREIGEFSKIIVRDNVEVILVPESSNTLTVSAGKNLMSKIVTETDGNTLTISNNNSCNWVRDFSVPIKVHISVSKLNEIEYRSIADISCTDTIFSDSLIINVYEGAGTLNILTNSNIVRSNLHYGTADMKVSGRCNLSFIYSASFGLVDNRNLISKMVYVTTKSSNNLYLNAQRSLTASIENIGNIYYSGNPNISLQQSGSGQLIKLQD